MQSRLYIAFHLRWIISYFLEQSLHQIRPDISLGELGADSFDMFELQALIEETFGILIHQPLRTYLTFAELVDLIFRAMPTPEHSPGSPLT
ncbi:acyl carrier protein [Pseudomonas entomophila]|uniref:acyl carrier protein n=1 Tax=Pseudomonas entomophila TaxID=312306 RepID=UPI001F02B04D|nr:phosphopantetheine-binding protein [Pseudomonas entomophila]MCG8293115.1 phosphopantetheine-binding protein [Pseudomonas entomophila]